MVRIYPTRVMRIKRLLSIDATRRLSEQHTTQCVATITFARPVFNTSYLFMILCMSIEYEVKIKTIHIYKHNNIFNSDIILC